MRSLIGAKSLQLLVPLAALACWAIPANAGPIPATVSGTITEAGIGTAISGVTVVAFNIDQNQVVDEALADSAGAYSLSIPVDSGSTRTVLIEAAGPDHAPARYGAIATPDCFFGCYHGSAGGEKVLAPGDSLSGIDLALTAGGRIAGTITEAGSGDPLPGATIEPLALNAYAYSVHFHGISDAAGAYEIPLALAPGNWHVHAIPDSSAGNWVIEAWNDRLCQHRRCPILDTDTVGVAAGGVTTGIDFDLQPGATISGTLTADPVNRIVRLWDAAGLMLDQRVLLSASDTGWAFPGLAGGSYFVELGPVTSLSPHVRQLHNGLPCPFGGCARARGSALTVAPGATLNAGSFSLTLGGQIEGTIVDDATGTVPVAAGGGQQIYDIIDASGQVIGGGPIIEDSGAIVIRPSSGLPPGDYYLRTWNEWLGRGIGQDNFGGEFHLPGYSDALAPDQPCSGVICNLGAVTPISVTAGATSSVTVRLQTGRLISGSVVVDATSDPIEHAIVKLFDASGRYVTGALTDGAGEFELGVFPSGNYRLRTPCRPSSGRDISASVMPISTAFTARPVTAPRPCAICPPAA